METKKTNTKCTKGFCWKRNAKKQRYFEEKSHILAYLDNEFLLVARTRYEFFENIYFTI